MNRWFGSTPGALSILVFTSASAVAADCDFQKRIGSCRASIVIENTSGSKGSYSAEIVVKSSASSCSKVDYLLDNTPHRTILKSRNSDEESLFGTKPITKKNIKVTGCSVFADRKVEANKGESEASVGSGSFNGSWTGNVGMLMMSAPMTLNLRVNGSSVSGNSTSPNGQSYVIQNGRVSGNTLTYTYQQPSGDGPASVRITKKSANSLSYAATADGFTLSGTLTRH